jgi:ATP-dependent DNA helicase RecG
LAGLYHNDETPVLGAGIEQLDQDAFAKYYYRVCEHGMEAVDVPLEPMLRNMRFLAPDLEGKLCLSLASLLLFGKMPQDHVPFARISAVRREGVEAGEKILDRKEIDGHLQ